MQNETSRYGFWAYVYGNQMMTILTSLYIIINPLLWVCVRVCASLFDGGQFINKKHRKNDGESQTATEADTLIERWLRFIGAGVTSLR